MDPSVGCGGEVMNGKLSWVDMLAGLTNILRSLSTVG